EAEELFTKSDIHTSTAETCRCSRDLAKVVNFGIIYGMYPKSLGFTLTKANWDACLEEHGEWDALRDTVDEDMARDIYEGFFRKYAGVKTYQKAVSERAKLQGYIETRHGQRRHLPDVWSSEWFLVSAAMRQAVNTTIQGHVGELMLLLMNRVERDPILRSLGFRQFMQVHDEVLGEAPKRNSEECKRRLTYIFQNPQEPTESFPYSGYRVPLIFEAKAGSTWGRVH
ncbi:MAG: hypothetical protein GF334_06450, partial [Candidatus Altiarchaeales archaeon]|nr:hypothetical protein [Candidatus Altiarchaeales archaeon]